MGSGLEIENNNPDFLQLGTNDIVLCVFHTLSTESTRWLSQVDILLFLFQRQKGQRFEGSAAVRIPFCEREGPTGLDDPGLFQDPWGNPNVPRVKPSDKWHSVCR